MNNNYYKLNELARKFYRGRGGTLRYIPNGKLRLDLYYFDDYGRKRRKVFVGRNIGECYERANQFAADSKDYRKPLDRSASSCRHINKYD